LGLEREIDVGERLLSEDLKWTREHLETAESYTGEDVDVERQETVNTVIAYVDATAGRHEDDYLDQLLTPVFGRLFATRGWRQRHDVHSSEPLGLPARKRQRRKGHRVYHTKKRPE
jgi:hypothetical protein